jgi:RNA polymerase sigma factor (sigma-70 family)
MVAVPTKTSTKILNTKSAIQRPPNAINSVQSEFYAETGRMLEQLGNAPLLSSKEEVELGKLVQELGLYENVYNSLQKQLNRKPLDDEWAAAASVSPLAFQQRLNLCRQAKRSMVSSNMRLVVSIAKKYKHLGVNFSDLIQEGSMGLIRATEKFDPTRGFKFSTYAAWWIQQSVMKSVANHSRVIRLPVHVHNLLYNIRKLKRQTLADTGGSLSDEELANRLQIPPSRLQRYLEASQSTLSTEKTSAPDSIKGPSNIVLGDLVRSKISSSAEDVAERLLLRRKLYEALSELPEDMRLIMALRYGLDDGVPKSISQVAELVSCNIEHARRCETKAMRKLRSPHNQMKMRQFIEGVKSQENEMLVL